MTVMPFRITKKNARTLSFILLFMGMSLALYILLGK
jgi:hypothetical protein